jgi:hypothetical protein
MLLVGGRQWKLCCYSRGMNDHQWMDVPEALPSSSPVHKSQMVCVSLLLRIHTLTHGDTVTLYLLLTSL